MELNPINIRETGLRDGRGVPLSNKYELKTGLDFGLRFKVGQFGAFEPIYGHP